MKQRAKGTWVITGAASGFGREFARRLAERGETLALWDRDAAGLEETRRRIPQARTHAVTVDVTDMASVERAATETLETLGSVAHVVHCAGVLRVGRVEAVSAADHALMMNVNYLGSVHVAKALLPQLEDARGRATLLFVASVAGLRGFPELAGYCASKHAVVGFAQALRDELHGTNVDVRLLCPPPGDTPMVQQLERLPPIYKLSKMFTAEEIVDAALKGLDRRAWIQLVDLSSKALLKVGALAPGVVDRIIRLAAR
ncbi:MAG TPA: SDR family NAD(P)-dependent oxidoreductase [Polyangiaceae bacterium LLY-WYZ-15_(1-7)]|nr:hypothetical protein [Sandaracinus sp.]HJL02056.1 SDR family NAD(P)-dependent oxidoreductase [Polyangiaceae bacterium LLY-WYZ-15_(1-7)]MBJ71441.1 hypothetical protein [Sandaracinus sp.]HJL10269.1 SDR family NAD(P)-dependent oxidoreductase [Polyangiaceae bacterium LLY-WYZ-15_(1-7)]HJL23883.1 SDR family NAD(P)-dependent oxidoreductase [Polyangiaceae bacterium LLY-WYZ-15_(1-7)]